MVNYFHDLTGSLGDAAQVTAQTDPRQEYGRIGNLLDTDVDLIKHWISRGCGLQRASGRVCSAVMLVL